VRSASIRRTYWVHRHGTATSPYCELLADVNSGHNIVATVFIQCGSGYRTSGPEEMQPIGESEFVRAIAEESDRRGGKTKICAGIVSFADLRMLSAVTRIPVRHKAFPVMGCSASAEIRQARSRRAQSLASGYPALPFAGRRLEISCKASSCCPLRSNAHATVYADTLEAMESGSDPIKAWWARIDPNRKY
jgi:hypothetical protein